MSNLIETILGTLFFIALIVLFFLGIATFARHGERFVPGVVDHLTHGVK